MLLKLAVPLLSLSIRLCKINQVLYQPFSINHFFQEENLNKFENTVNNIPEFISQIDKIEEYSLAYLSEKHPSEVNINILFEEYIMESSLHLKHVMKGDNILKNILYYKELYEIYNDDEWFLEILNENLKYDLEYLRESMELVIDSYKFMGLFCRIHNNFVENNNKDLYKEGFNKLFDRFFYRIKRKKEDASYYLNNYLDNKELLVNFMNNCNR